MIIVVEYVRITERTKCFQVQCAMEEALARCQKVQIWDRDLGEFLIDL